MANKGMRILLIWRKIQKSIMSAPKEFIGPVNLGNPKEITIKELAEKIIKMIKSNGTITYATLPENDPLRRQPDITLAKKMLDWEPTFQLDIGLEETINYFKDILKNSDVDPRTINAEKFQKKPIPSLA